ncbi:hypothetical protein Pfo_015287 [Paulownia fortunei]|nr:hypothetical protein Pfo_015287 [Paulownia fortunei]
MKIINYFVTTTNRLLPSEPSSNPTLPNLSLPSPPLLLSLPTTPTQKITRIEKQKFQFLNVTDNNYLSWCLDIKLHLRELDLAKTLNYVDIKKANGRDKANAMIFIGHHLSEDLKDEYIQLEKLPADQWADLEAVSIDSSVVPVGMVDVVFPIEMLIEMTMTNVTIHAEMIIRSGRPTEMIIFIWLDRGNQFRKIMIKNMSVERPNDNICNRCEMTGHWLKFVELPNT